MSSSLLDRSLPRSFGSISGRRTYAFVPTHVRSDEPARRRHVRSSGRKASGPRSGRRRETIIRNRKARCQGESPASCFCPSPRPSDIPSRTSPFPVDDPPSTFPRMGENPAESSMPSVDDDSASFTPKGNDPARRRFRSRDSATAALGSRRRPGRTQGLGAGNGAGEVSSTNRPSLAYPTRRRTASERTAASWARSPFRETSQKSAARQPAGRTTAAKAGKPLPCECRESEKVIESAAADR